MEIQKSSGNRSGIVGYMRVGRFGRIHVLYSNRTIRTLGWWSRFVNIGSKWVCKQ